MKVNRGGTYKYNEDRKRNFTEDRWPHVQYVFSLIKSYKHLKESFQPNTERPPTLSQTAVERE